MDYDSSSKFISSLAKFLQSLCNGYVEFDNGVQVIGHLYLSVDTGTTIDYILNEKVCKTDENSVTFISNSFHAQPAEKPKPQGRRTAKESDKTESKNEENVEINVGSQAELRSTNIGTLPASHNSHGAKRPYSPSQKQSSSKSGRSSPRHKRSRTESLDQNIQSQASNPASENSISSAPSPAADGISSNITTAQSSDDAPYGDSYQQSFFNPDEENSMADESEERDIKPSIDTDVTFIKEEFAPSSSCAQSSSQNRDRSHGEDSSVFPYQSNQVFPGAFSGGGGFGASGSQRSNFSAAGDRSSHLFGAGQSSSQIEGGENSGDPSDLKEDITSDFLKLVEESDLKTEDVDAVKYQATSGPLFPGMPVLPPPTTVKSENADSMPFQVFPDVSDSVTDDHSSLVGDVNGEHAASFFQAERAERTKFTSSKLFKYGAKQKPSKAKGVFACELCGKEYSYKRGLQRHKWVCADVKRFQCEFCDLTFNLRHQYRKHLRDAHGMQTDSMGN